MKVVQPGHIYDLDNKTAGTQRITFFKDLPHGVNGHDGILSQEFMRVALDRYITLYVQKPCIETHTIIMYLRECLKLSEVRAFGNTLDKSYAKCGLHIEQLPVLKNGHLFSLSEGD